MMKSFFEKWFRITEKTDSSLNVHLDQIKSWAKPGIRLNATPQKTFSRIGGLPQLPSDVAWPEWKGEPLAFLAQIDLSEMPVDCRSFPLPESGILYFFYTQDQDAWGFDPEDRGAWRILYSTSSTTLCVARAKPEKLRDENVFASKFIRFSKVVTYPPSEDERVQQMKLDDQQMREFWDFSAQAHGTPAHHLFGYAQPVQSSDMDLECQLASNGLYCGNDTGYNDPKAKVLEPGKTEWILLLQLDTDDDTKMMWGDAGMLYFWIRKEDLKVKNFSNVWMILQCG